MGQPVEQRPSEALGAEGFRSFIEGQVACDQRGPALVALRGQFKEQLGPAFGERDEAQLVNDQQRCCHIIIRQVPCPRRFPRKILAQHVAAQNLLVVEFQTS